MAKPKFSLSLKPTFTATVAIPVPGEGTADVVFTFKGRTREQFAALMEEEAPLKIDRIMNIISGWDLDDPFDREHVEQLLNNYMGAFDAIQFTYMRELTEARLKN